MGALDGSITFRSFFVDGSLPTDFKKRFLANIQHHAFAPLTPDSEDDRHLGWVSVHHPLDTTFNDPNKVFYNEYLCLGLRVDRWSIPSTLLKAHLTEASQQYMQEAGLDQLGRRDKQLLKDRVTFELKRRLIPSMKVVDMVWHLDQQLVRFWSHSNSLGEEFMERFQQTFSLQLVPNSPYTAAMALSIPDAQLERLSRVEPDTFTVFTDSPVTDEAASS